MNHALSISPVLVAATFLFLIGTGWRVQVLSRPERITYASVIAILAAWVALSIMFSMNGFYDSDRFYSLLPALWLPLIPLVICLLAMALRSFRQAIFKITVQTPLHWFVWFEALRIASIGTLIKMFLLEFPLVLELAVGIPDLLLGFSAPFVARWVQKRRFSLQALALWHFLGIAVILINGLALLHLSMPGPHYLIQLEPNASVLFDYPLVMSPTFVIPMLITINLWMVVYLTYFRCHHAMQ